MFCRVMYIVGPCPSIACSVRFSVALVLEAGMAGDHHVLGARAYVEGCRNLQSHHQQDTMTGKERLCTPIPLPPPEVPPPPKGQVHAQPCCCKQLAAGLRYTSCDDWVLCFFARGRHLAHSRTLKQNSLLGCTVVAYHGGSSNSSST